MREKQFIRAITCGDPVCCSCSCALEFASLYSREGIFQALVAGCFSKLRIELAVLTSSLWTCALGSNAGISPSACGVGIQGLYTPPSGEAGLALRASSAPTAGRHFAICVS